MKNSSTTLVLAGLTAVLSATSSADASDRDPRMIMPTDIQPVALTADERNPFEKRVELKTEEDVQEGIELSEEDRVRQRFNELEVKGGSSGKRILLADIILEQGKPVDPVLVGQTIRLMVTEISTAEIELTWIDDVGKKRPRTIVLPYDLSPKIGFQLPGQTKLEDGDAPVLASRVMPRNERPKPPPIKAAGPDGGEREIDASQIVGQ